MTRRGMPARLRRAATPPTSPAAGPAASSPVVPLIDGPASLALALDALAARDPAVIAHLLEVAGPPPLRQRPPGFAGLAAIVVGQQVSTASAAAIHGRLVAALDPLSPAALLAAGDDTLRAVGLSAAKVRTLRAVAAAAQAGTLPLDALGTLGADAAHAMLVAVPGIGPWTADSFLLFCLGHPDAWPAGDLALQEAARVALGLPQRPTAREMEAIGMRWRPYRAVAARLLWAYYRAIKGRGGALLAAP